MKNQFTGVLGAKKGGLKMVEKKMKNEGHSRMFLSGIFDACSYKIKGKIPELARVRLALSGSSTFVVSRSSHWVILNLTADLPHKLFMHKTTLSGRFRIGVRNDFMGKRRGWKMLKQVQGYLMLFAPPARHPAVS